MFSVKALSPWALALCLAGCATAAPQRPATAPAKAEVQRVLAEGEVCGSDDVNGPAPNAPRCGPRLVCVGPDVLFGVSPSQRPVRRCDSQIFFGPR
jgi:hypothetical protein